MRSIKFTRKQYMAKQCTHQEYYAQFVTPIVAKAVVNHIGLPAIKASTDEAFNDIPLQAWDNVGLGFQAHVAPLMKEAGDTVALGGLVCIAKAAARIIKDAS